MLLFSAAVESSNDAIITESLDGTITGWNPAAERLFGFTAAEAVGEGIDFIVPPDRLTEMHRRHTEMLSEIMSDDDLQTVTTTLRRLERFWIHTGAPVERPGQYASGF